MGWGMSMLGFAALKKSFEGMIPGVTDVWEIGPSTDYDVYVEFGTSRMPARPYVKPGAEKGMAALDELERKAKDMNALLRLLALRMESKMKREIQEKNIIDTGNLFRSVEAVKR